MTKKETHDAEGLQLAPHKVKGRTDVWWYEEGRGMHIVVERRERGTTTFLIPWVSVRNALKRKDA